MQRIPVSAAVAMLAIGPMFLFGWFAGSDGEFRQISNREPMDGVVVHEFQGSAEEFVAEFKPAIEMMALDKQMRHESDPNKQLDIAMQMLEIAAAQAVRTPHVCNLSGDACRIFPCMVHLCITRQAQPTAFCTAECEDDCNAEKSVHDCGDCTELCSRGVLPASPTPAAP